MLNCSKKNFSYSLSEYIFFNLIFQVVSLYLRSFHTFFWALQTSSKLFFYYLILCIFSLTFIFLGGLTAFLPKRWANIGHSSSILSNSVDAVTSRNEVIRVLLNLKSSRSTVCRSWSCEEKWRTKIFIDKLRNDFYLSIFVKDLKRSYQWSY